MINNIIVEGADQQGKTTLCNAISEKLGWPIKHFGLPSPTFDFKHGYQLPKHYISDRNFISEMVYSRLQCRHCRVAENLEWLENTMCKNTLVIFADRRDDFIFGDRKELYTEADIQKSLYLYRYVVDHVLSIKIKHINVGDERQIHNIINHIQTNI